MASTSEQEILQKISVLEDRFREYQENTRARMIAMEFRPGEDRPTHLAALYENEIQITAFSNLIYAENINLKKIRAAEEEKRRVEARAAKEAAKTAAAAAALAAQVAAQDVERKMHMEAMIREQVVQRAMAAILATIT